MHCYLGIINTLACVGEGEQYILAEGRIEDGLIGGGGNGFGVGIGKAKKMLKRQVVTLEGLRKEYQAELDRVEAIERGAYPFVDQGDEMDIL